MRNGTDYSSTMTVNRKQDLDGNHNSQDRTIKKKLSFVCINYDTSSQTFLSEGTQKRSSEERQYSVTAIPYHSLDQAEKER